MKLLYFSESLGVHDRRFLEAFVDGGLRTAFLSLSATRGEEPVSGVEVICPEGLNGPDATAEDQVRVERLRNFISEAEPDAVHSGPITTCAHLVSMIDHPWKIAMSWGYDLLRDAAESPATREIARATLLDATALVCDSEVVRKRASAIVGNRPLKIIQFPWGTDLDLFYPPEKATDEPGIHLLSTRSLEPIYGPKVLLEGFKRANAMQAELRLTVAGNGTLRADCEMFVRENGLDDVVQFVGSLRKREELAALYRTADIYITCSMVDGSSVSLLEAMACGLPVVASDIAGNREWLAEGRGGEFFAAGNPTDLARVLLGVARLSKEARQVQGAWNRAVVEQRADWSRNSELLLDYYRKGMP